MNGGTLDDLPDEKVDALEERLTDAAARLDETLTNVLNGELEELPEEIDDEYLANLAEVVQS